MLVTGVTDLLMVVLGGQQLLVAVSLYGDDLGSQLLYLGAQPGPSVFLLDVQSCHGRLAFLLQLPALPLLTAHHHHTAIVHIVLPPGESRHLEHTPY